MLSSSASDPSGTLSDNLKKKKPIDLPDATTLYRFILNRVRNEALSYMSPDHWDRLVAKAVEDPELPSAKRVLSQPFTEAHSFYSSVFQDGVDDIPLQEDEDAMDSEDDMNPLNDIVEAATALRNNKLWEAVKQHVVMDNETSCRTAIDLILLSAVTVAQKRVQDDRTIDIALSERHELPPSTKKNLPRSWVVIHQEVKIPNQRLLPTLAAHGVLDYMVGVAPAQRVLAHLRKLNVFLTKSSVYKSTLNHQHVRVNIASVKEAKAEATFANPKSEMQAIAQGASLCVFTKRASIINCLTDGTRWKFFRVTKTPDQPASTMESSSTSLSTETPKPFKAANTRELNIFALGDLEIILRLLVLSILCSADEFVDAAKGT